MGWPPRDAELARREERINGIPCKGAGGGESNGGVKVDETVGTKSPVVAGRSLAERFRAGEARALDEVVREYQEVVARLVYRLTGWRSADVEDVVQEVFVAAVRSARKFDGR